MNTKRQIAFIIQMIYLSMIVALLYLFFHAFFHILFPFLIGFIIAFLLRPIIRWMTKRMHHETLCAIICILLFYITIGSMIVLLCMKGYVYLKDFIIHLPTLYEMDIKPFFDQLSEQFYQISKKFHPDQYVYLQTFLNNIETSVSSFITTYSSQIFVKLTNIASSLPNIALSISMALMSSFFFTKDYHIFTRFFLRQLSVRHRLVLMATSKQVKHSLQKYLIAYGKLMIITFIELCIGLACLHIDSWMMIAFLISLFDFFPVLGAGGIMIPWIIFCYITLQTKQAVGLLILLLIMTIIRNIAEPQIVGHEFNLHPLIMLAAMYFGAKFFGLLGMLITPFMFMIIKQLHEDHIIHIYHDS